MNANPLTGATNFRDLGGYTTADGATVALGRLYRSDHLGALTEDDARQVSALRIRRVLDLRGVTERASAMTGLEGVTVHALSIEPTIVQRLNEMRAAGTAITPADVVRHMHETYRGFVLHNSGRFAQLFAHLLESNEPLVFHCTAGKDRTGFAAAMIHLALGVSHEDVLRDYLLTNERLVPPPATLYSLAPEVAQVLYRVQPDFLHAALDAVQERYGNLEAYFREGLGLDDAARARLRVLYLEDAAAL